MRTKPIMLSLAAALIAIGGAAIRGQSHNGWD
jgi:hypothetical protein